MFMKISFIILLLLFNNISLYDITLQDDAFHADLPLHIETWYFEAIFESNESMVFMITSLGSESKGILMIGVHFYENGKIVYEKRDMYTSFYLSSETPYIVAEGNEIMKGFLNEEGKICYNISYTTSSISFNLYFENTTKGWKSNDGWLAIPNMRVEGNILINGKEKNVNGKGYHDHNIFFLLSPFVKRGYMDGKIMMSNFSVVWAKLMKNVFMQEDFVIFSNSSYNLIENVSIICYDYEINHGKLIPTSFHISAANENVVINISLRAISVHFIRLPLLHYWRYHVHATGKIKMEGGTIEVDTFDIMEYMLFT